MKTAPEVAMEPIMADAKTAAALCGVARSTWLSWDSAGLCPRSVRIIGRVLWPVEDLRRWADWGCLGREAFEARKAAMEASR